MFNNIKKTLKQNKIVVGASALILGATQSQAAIAFDPTTGFSGTMDMVAYNTAVPIVVAVIATIIAVTLGIRALKGAKSA